MIDSEDAPCLQFPMISFAPLMSEITDSSVWEEPYHVRILWLTMLARKQADHVVYADAYRLRKWSNLKSIEEVEEGLRILSSPDERRLGQEFGGRRIEKVEDGWLVLNGQKYEDMMRKISERIRKAKWAREHRAKGGGGKPRPDIGGASVNKWVENGTPKEEGSI